MKNIVITGRTTAPIELQTITRKNGKTVSMARFTIANDDDRKNRDDNSRVDFFDATVWGAQAEALAKYAPASRRILIEGVPHVERYTAKDGTNRRHFNITVQAFQFMDERIPETPVEKADPLPDNFAADGGSRKQDGKKSTNVTYDDWSAEDGAEDDGIPLARLIDGSDDDLPF